jgi:hypothetical protein
MFQTAVLTAAFTLATTALAYAQQMPAQPPPVASPLGVAPLGVAPLGLGEGNPQERTACHPDVTRYCQTQLQVNPNDVLGILGCLQANRPKISHACAEVLASHGQ